MSNIEDQIVQMQFDNKQFESGVATSMGTIDKLNQSLQFKNGVSGIDQINKAASGMNLNPIAAGIQGINKAWLGMTTIAVTALANITNKAVDAGLKMGKALTIDPIKAGFSNYETKVNAVQTILANTADQGTNLKQVTGQLNVLNTYANQTVYNFAEMAKNIGTFTAAGVDLKTSVSSIKGIANLAALSGSTSEQASSAMYQLSQAIAAGQVHLQDWNSVVNAGIGGAAFQKNLIETALATGTLDKSQVHLGKTMADTKVNGVAFRQSLTPPPGGGATWLTSGVLTKSLSTFTGDLSKAQLRAEGYHGATLDAIYAQAQMARKSATEVRTFSALFQDLKEEVASAWASVFQALFGNIKQATAFLSPLHTTIENALTKPIYGVAAALGSWRKAGGFEDIIAIFTNLAKIVGNLLYPFKALFGAIIPGSKASGKGLEGVTKALAEFTGFLVKVTSVTHKLGPVFHVFGLALKEIWYDVKIVLDQFKRLDPVISTITGKLSQAGNGLGDIWSNITAGILSGLDPASFEKAVRQFANNIIIWIKDTLGIHSPATTMVPVGINIVQGIVQGLQAGATFLLHGVQQLFVGLGQLMKTLAENINFDDVITVINTGLNLGLLLVFHQFVKAFGGTMKSFQSIMGQGGEVLDQIKDNLKTMQNQVRAKIIRDIAISVALLAASAILLSSVDSRKLKVALAAIGGLMISLVASMKILTAGGGGKHNAATDPKTIAKQSAQILAIGAAMIEFATAVLVMTSAVALMGQLKPDTIKKGLLGVAGVIGIITAATAILGKTGGGATMLATATAMFILAGALTAFVGVMKLYSTLDFKTLVRGGGAAALVILAVGGAMRVFGKNGITGAAGMVIAAAALKIMAGSLKVLSAIRFDHLLKAVIALDFILASMAGAAAAMTEALPGAAAMLVMAAATIVLAKAIQIIAGIGVGNLIKVFIALVFYFGAIAVAAALLSPAVPLIAAFGFALLLVGGAILAAGVGILAFATAMGILAVVGPAAFVALSDGIDLFVKKLPEIGMAIGGFLVSILTGIALAAGPLGKAIGKLLGILIDELAKLIPKARHLFQQVINAILDIIVHSQAHAAKLMIHFLLGMLGAIDDKLPKFIKRGTDIIVNLIGGLAKANNRITNATGLAILTILNGLDKAIRKYERPILAAGRKIAFDIVDGMTGGLLGYGVDQVKAAAEHIASSLPGWMKKVLHINSPSTVMRDEVGQWAAKGVAEGLDKHASAVEKSAGELANRGLEAMKATFKNSKNAAHNLIDTTPKITPVLDLTELERQASKIGSTIGNHTISADVSRKSARSIAANHALAKNGSGHEGGDTFNFNQVNNSPKPINHVAVYRHTKSQLGMFREQVKR